MIKEKKKEWYGFFNIKMLMWHYLNAKLKFIIIILMDM